MGSLEYTCTKRAIPLPRGPVLWEAPSLWENYTFHPSDVSFVHVTCLDQWSMNRSFQNPASSATFSFSFECPRQEYFSQSRHQTKKPRSRASVNHTNTKRTKPWFSQVSCDLEGTDICKWVSLLSCQSLSFLSSVGTDTTFLLDSRLAWTTVKWIKV